MPEVSEKAITDALCTVLIYFFTDAKAPTRPQIIEKMVSVNPDLAHARLDLRVARHINWLVGREILKRHEAKYYVPGDAYTSGEGN